LKLAIRKSPQAWGGKFKNWGCQPKDRGWDQFDYLKIIKISWDKFGRRVGSFFPLFIEFRTGFEQVLRKYFHTFFHFVQNLCKFG
jgi:hypothetical protein